MCDESLSEESVADNRLADGLTACAASRPVDDRRITDPVGGGAIRANGGGCRSDGTNAHHWW